MELWRASMIPIIGDSSGPNGFGAIATSDPSPRTSRSSIIDITVIAASKAKPPYRWSKRLASSRSCHPQSSHCRKWTTSRMGQSLSSVLSGAIEGSISSENILSFPRPLSIPMSEPKSFLICIKFRFILVMTWLLLSLISYRHGLLLSLQQGNLCIDTC
jgi:hypothetical protein